VRSSLVALLLAILATDVASAQPFESVGTRAQGMAGAFVAVADDATAVYWNPAGIPTGHFFSLLADYSKSKRRQPTGFPDSPAFDGSGTIVALSTNEIAFSYYRLHINQMDRRPAPGASPDLGQEDQGGDAMLRSVYTHNVAVTGAQLVYPGVSLGTSVRYVYGSVGIAPGAPGLSVGDLLREADGVERQGQSKVDVDIGVMIGSDTIRFGVAARNLLQPRFDTPDGGSLRLDRQVRAGLGIRTVAGLLIAVDVDLSSARSDSVDGTRRNVALGVEHWFGQWLGIRGGARVNVEAEDPRAVGAFGMSVALMSGVYLDGQVTRGRDSIERGWGIAARVGF
jgi:hypothetical protein